MNDQTNLIMTAALEIARKVYGGVSMESPEWQKCKETAEGLVGMGVAQVPRIAAFDERKAFQMEQDFNTKYPVGTSGTIDLGNGRKVATKVSQRALVFPEPYNGEKVMAWFQGVGWREVHAFLPEVKGATLAEQLTMMAVSNKQQGNPEVAEHLLDAAIRADPQCWHAYNEKGVLYAAKQKFAEALEYYDIALGINPTSGEMLNNRAMAYRGVGRPHDAVKDARRAFKLLPGQLTVELNTATALDDVGDLDGCLAILNAYLERDPDNVNIHYNKSIILLAAGALQQGWQEFDWRLRQMGANGHYEHYDIPRWNGEPLDGKNVLIWPEQGVGDEILTSTMIPDITARGAKVFLLASERLTPIFRRSFPDITVNSRPNPAPVVLFERKRLAPEYCPAFMLNHKMDYQMSQCDLGKHLRPSISAFPDRPAPLKPDTGKAVKFREKLESLYPDAREFVGISWHSRKNIMIGEMKSRNLIDFAPILQVPGCVFVNLQYGDSAAEIAAVRKELGCDIVQMPDVDPLKDMDTFMSLVAAMGRVVTVSNSTAHVAGAQNTPTVVITPEGPGRMWYWFRDMISSPWYPSVTLMRQPSSTHWDKPIADTAEVLRRTII